MLNGKIFLPAILAIVAGVFFKPVTVVAQEDLLSRIEAGKAIAFNRFKGNCLACHYVEGGELMGNYGPPLIYMKARYPDRDALREQIWDLRSRILIPACRRLAVTEF